MPTRVLLFSVVRVLCLLALCVCASISVSDAATTSYTLVYVNGINTTKADARAAAVTLSRAVGSSYNDEAVGIVLAYNPTRGALNDLPDVFQQKLNQYPSVPPEKIIKGLSTGVIDSSLPAALQNEISSYQVRAINDFGYLAYNDSDLKDIVGAIRSDMVVNQKIVLVPHSQGNLYANAAYAVLTSGSSAVPPASLGIMAVASPAATVAAINGNYLTSLNDAIISGVRATGVNMLPANFTIGVASENLLGHNFASIYLNPAREGYSELLSRLRAVMSSLVAPGGQGTRGPLTVTLNWGGQTDIDLHVFEPDGTHVYYNHKIGTVGALDIDNMVAYGPEHYYTAYSTLTAGTYRLAVNYFAGDAPEVATITIATPFGSTTKTVNLPSSNGTLGDTAPLEVGSIVVTRTATGGYAFQVL